MHLQPVACPQRCDTALLLSSELARRCRSPSARAAGRSPSAQTLSVLAAAGCHKDAVRGVRWLGPTTRLVSFSSERVQHGQATRNALVLTDARSRSCLPFRCARGPCAGAACAGAAGCMPCKLHGPVQLRAHVACQGGAARCPALSPALARQPASAVAAAAANWLHSRPRSAGPPRRLRTAAAAGWSVPAPAAAPDLEQPDRAFASRRSPSPGATACWCCREVGAEDAPMLGIRASPSGSYLLVLLRGKPAELWQVRMCAGRPALTGHRPVCLGCAASHQGFEPGIQGVSEG